MGRTVKVLQELRIILFASTGSTIGWKEGTGQLGGFNCVGAGTVALAMLACIQAQVPPKEVCGTANSKRRIRT